MTNIEKLYFILMGKISKINFEISVDSDRKFGYNRNKGGSKDEKRS